MGIWAVYVNLRFLGLSPKSKPLSPGALNPGGLQRTWRQGGCSDRDNAATAGARLPSQHNIACWILAGNKGIPKP